MSDPKNNSDQQSKPKKSYYGVFDPKAHQEKYETKLDKAWEDLHNLTLENKEKSDKFKEDNQRIHDKSTKADLKLAKVRIWTSKLTFFQNIQKLTILEIGQDGRHSRRHKLEIWIYLLYEILFKLSRSSS